MLTTIDIRELSTRLDEVLAAIGSGAEVILTDGAVLRARIVPCGGASLRVAGLHPGGSRLRLAAAGRFLDGSVMRLLLDTHTFIWWDSDPGRLSAVALSALRDPTNTPWLSVVSVWEILIKVQLGKLTIRLPLPDIVAQQPP